MGIKGLNKFIQGKSSNVITTVSPHEFKDKKVAIDASIFMYKYLHAAQKCIVSQTDLINSQVNQQDVFQLWIDYTLKFILKWLNYQIVPVFVFDGDAIKEKKKVIDQRHLTKEQKKEKINELTLQLEKDGSLITMFELKDLLVQYIDITPSMRQLYKEIIQSTGIPCFEATGEAEQLCTMLCLENHVDAVCTKDIDVLAYGCPIMIKGFTDDNLLEVIELNRTLTDLHLTFDQFVDLCVMCGTDYNQNIKGLGPARAYKLIKMYGSFNDIPLSAYHNLFKKMTMEELEQALQLVDYDMCHALFRVVYAKHLTVSGDVYQMRLKPMNAEYQKYWHQFVSEFKP